MAGVIDSGYRGDIKVVMTSPVDLVVRAGDRIAQMVVVPCLMEASEWVEDLDATDRGDKGFGSSGQ
ncbi:MAG: hypothetical protein IPF74_15955 [Rhodocyclaceae bacterium]|nr:hypothetical protein [Rhodocyclaceae bacterium]